MSAARWAARCARCLADATVLLNGKYRNGRAAREFRCDRHSPGDDEFGTWLLNAASQSFRLTAIVRPPEPLP